MIEILRDLGFDLDVGCVRIVGHAGVSGIKAIVKVEDSLFARNLSNKLKEDKSTLIATPMPIDTKGANCRKVKVSWHKATRSAWVNFGNGDIANRVAKKFEDGIYKCLGQTIKASTASQSAGRGRRGGSSYNPVAWTILLSDIPGNAKVGDIERTIIHAQDKPRHIELGAASYEASEAEVSVQVRSQLERHGPLESFSLAPSTAGKRVKATARFQEEADARSAVSLNNTPLRILGNGKFTVTLIQAAKIKISTSIYVASKSMIDEASEAWRMQHLDFRVYEDTLRQYTTLKLEGNEVKVLANARKTLEKILDGIVLEKDGTEIWDTALSSNGKTYMNLKAIAEELRVVIIRDKSMRQLRFYGPLETFHEAVRRVSDMLREDSRSSYEIELKPHQFSWTIRGGFKSIEQVLGSKVAIFNVVSKKITINGTQQQYETTLAIMDGRYIVSMPSSLDGTPETEGDCPICFCEAETPIKTSCGHAYCLECFEECCKSAASTCKAEFQIQCHGNEGTCPTVFTLQEVKGHVSSSAFETVLKSAFEEYVKRHPEIFRYCPTPDCGCVYRCTPSSTSKALPYMCPNCLEQICTSCHSIHGKYTCADYKEIVSGGYEALAKLKKELHIKDCPRCKTPMEKMFGCNHMTCPGCTAHICWACMEVFKDSGPCYAHMNKMHGGIGGDLERFMD